MMIHHEGHVILAINMFTDLNEFVRSYLTKYRNICNGYSGYTVPAKYELKFSLQKNPAVLSFQMEYLDSVRRVVTKFHDSDGGGFMEGQYSRGDSYEDVVYDEYHRSITIEIPYTSLFSETLEADFHLLKSEIDRKRERESVDQKIAEHQKALDGLLNRRLALGE